MPRAIDLDYSVVETKQDVGRERLNLISKRRIGEIRANSVEGFTGGSASIASQWSTQVLHHVTIVSAQ